MYKKKFFRNTLSAACLLALGNAAHAEVVVGGNNGWEVGFDGNINGFLVTESQDAKPAGAIGGTISNDSDSSRIRTGLLPSVFGFNVRSPMVNGLKGDARIGFYPQIQNSNTKNQFGSQVDLREAFFRVSGNFGQVLVGRSLSLYQSKNLLTDMSLFGVGVQGGVSGGGTTLGRIGYGYVYAQFNAGIVYSTPDMNGFKASLGLYDPSQIAGDTAATETNTPRFEGELSYAGNFGETRVQSWLSGMTQEAKFTTGGDVRASGLAYGLSLGFGGFDLTASGFTGDAVGSTLMLDTDSLDLAGNERDSSGYILQSSYTTPGGLKIGLSYGVNKIDETSADLADRLAKGNRRISEQSSLTLGAYYDVNKWLKLVAEYTRATNEWHGPGDDQESDLFAVGGFFLW